MTWQPAANRYETMLYNRCGQFRPEAAGDLARPVAQFRRRHAASDQAGDLPQGLRPRHHPFRPRQQLRSAAGLGGERLSATSCAPISPASATSWSFRPRPAICMWPGPYGEWGSRKYLLASLDQSLKRMGLDYVDIFYSHRFDPDTPLEETMLRARSCRALRQGALRRHLVLQLAAHPRGSDASSANSARPASSISRAIR